MQPSSRQDVDASNGETPCKIDTLSDSSLNSGGKNVHNDSTKLAKELRKLSSVTHMGAAAGVVLAVLALSNIHTFLKGLEAILYYIGIFIIRVVGLTLALGLSLGFASHVHDTLEEAAAAAVENREENVGEAYSLRASSRKLSNRLGASASLSMGHGKENSYINLMARAGYALPSSGPLRGEITKATEGKEIVSGEHYMEKLWPNLPKCINKEIGSMLDLIVRDYITCWFHKVDIGVSYVDPAISKKMELNEKKNQENCLITSNAPYFQSPFLQSVTVSLSHVLGQLASVAGESVNVMELLLIHVVKAIGKTLKVYREMKKSAIERARWMKIQQHQTKDEETQKKKGNLTDSTKLSWVRSSFREKPGTIQADAEVSSLPQKNLVNASPGSDESAGNQSDIGSNAVPSTKIPSQDKHCNDTSNDNAEAANESSSHTSQNATDDIAISEVAIAREFLLAGRLHKAITFGMDTTSVLFGDPSGKFSMSNDTDLSPATDPKEDKSNILHDDKVLYERLFKSKLLYECELDYNRVLSHRLCRKLISPSDSGSPIVRGMAVECLAGCILTPVMGMFAPDYVNGWIVQGIDAYLGSSTDTPASETNTSNIDHSSKTDHVDNIAIGEVKSSRPVTVISSQSILYEKKSDSSYASDSNNNMKGEDISINDESNSNSPTDQKIVNLVDGKEIFPKLDTKKVDIMESASANNDETKDVNNSVININVPSLVNYGPLIPMKEEHSEQEHIVDVDMDYMHDIAEGVTHIFESAGDSLADTDDDVSITADDEVSHIDHPEEDAAPCINDKGCTEEISNTSTNTLVKDEQNKEESDHIIPILTLSAIEMQNYVESGTRNEYGEVDWGDSGIKGTVCQLVLVLEAALKNGRRRKRLTPKMSQRSNSTDTDAQPSNADEQKPVDAMSVVVTEGVESVSSIMEPSPPSLVMLLMEMTTDITSFEEKLLANDNLFEKDNDELEEEEVYSGNDADKDNYTKDLNNGDYIADESATVRTLIVAWLQTGEIYHAIRAFTSSKKLLRQFYYKHAFFRLHDNRDHLLSHLKGLGGMDVLVDTMAVLAADGLVPPRIKPQDKSDNISHVGTDLQEQKNRRSSDDDDVRDLQKQQTLSSSSVLRGWADKNQDGNSQSQRMSFATMKANIRSNNQRLKRLVGINNGNSNLMSDQPISSKEMNSPSSNMSFLSSSSTHGESVRRSTAAPHHIDFRKNQSFAESLRMERDRRSDAWRKASHNASATTAGKIKLIDIICKPATQSIHRELHSLARYLYASTLSVEVVSNKGGNEKARIILEAISSRRMIEVPDDDSSFLLRAQPRPLNTLGVHVDKKSNDNSFRCYASSFEEPVTTPDNRYSGGRYIRPCLLRYYPSDRTSTMAVSKNERQICPGSSSKEAFLPEKFLNKRNLCQRSNARGTTGSVVLLSNTMEPHDFNSIPRTGKAFDFIYRMTLFECPMIDISGKKFTVHDKTKLGPHRADSSVIELSDASLSLALMLSGDSLVDEKKRCNSLLESEGEVESSPDNIEETIPNNEAPVESKADAIPNKLDITPMIHIMIPNSNNDNGSKNQSGDATMKCFRPSFIRAALMIASARQEAQFQCLIWAVKIGSAKKASRLRTESLLQPTLTILDFASSLQREKESVLLRDLKLGIGHIDREQLRRNSILLPRYPTLLRGLNAKVEGSIEGHAPNVDTHTTPPATLYKIRCVALVEVILEHDSDMASSEFSSTNAQEERKVYREEWVVYRPFREFITLHKHLKSQVSANESSSGGAGARLAAVATAAVFAPGSNLSGGHKQRKPLILSLAAASKAGALTSTKKSIEKRRVILNQYLGHLLSRNNLLRRCPELHLFLGADTSFPEDLENFSFNQTEPDFLGRCEIKTTRLKADNFPEIGVARKPAPIKSPVSKKKPQMAEVHTPCVAKLDKDKASNGTTKPNHEENSKLSDTSAKAKIIRQAQIASVKSRVQRVKLTQVRNAVFEFIRYQFDLDNSSFFRSRLVSAIRTMSYIVTSSQEFNRLLLDTHLSYINGKSLSEMIAFLRVTLWPGGVFYTAAPPLRVKEKEALSKSANKKLAQVFPDQLGRLLGQEITEEGISLLHEMLQNRVVVRSLGYMITDMLWVNIFPDLGDILSGSAALGDDD